MSQRFKPSFRRGMAKPTVHQRRVLRELWPRFGLDCDFGDQHELDGVFGRSAPRLLEIGFGLGDALLQHAQAQPDWDHLGIEMHKPGVARLLEQVDANELTNLRVMRRDARVALRDHIQQARFQEVWLFFPEPYPRAADAERRIVSPVLLDLLATACLPTACLRLATDDESTAAHMRAVAQAHSQWQASELSQRFAGRPVTKYEQRALDAGRSIVDLELTRAD